MSPEATRSPAVFLISTKTVVPGSPLVPSIDTGKVFVGDGIAVMIGANGAVVSMTVMSTVSPRMEVSPDESRTNS